MNYHIIMQAADRKTINVVFHISIPGIGENEAAIQWRDALVLSLGGVDKVVSVLPGISGAELTAMKAGEIYELSKSVRFSKLGLTDAQRRAEVAAAFTSESALLVAEKQITLNFIGYEGNV